MNRKKESEKVVSYTAGDLIDGESGRFHYLEAPEIQTTSVDKKKANSRKNLTVRIFAFPGFGLGLFLMFLTYVVYENETTDYESLVFLAGWGLFLSFGALASLSVSALIFPTRKFSTLKKSALVTISAFLLFFTLNSSFLAFAGSKIPCVIDPDNGICPCDKRTLLKSEETPVFDTEKPLPSLLDSVVVASIGDTEIEENGRKVLELMKSKNPDIVVINGDLTYDAEPEGLGKLLDEIFGDEVPVMITVGNHDTGIFTEYQKVLLDRYEDYLERKSGLDPLEVMRCEGEIGVNQFCSFKNMGFLFSGIGSSCGNNRVLNDDLESNLSEMNNLGLIWRNVFIHKNQKLLQTGNKRNEVGINAYEQSLKFGAMMHNAHEHQYVRTKELLAVGTKEKDFKVAETEFLDGKEVIDVGPGSFAVIANGIGGKSLRDPNDGLDRNEWWSVVFNENSESINFGAHFCEYNFQGDPTLAFCYFETIDGFVVDEYFVRSNH